MRKINKSIDIVDMIEKLYNLDRELESLPKVIGGKVDFKLVIDNIGDIICLADQYKVDLFEPTPSLPFHWCIIPIGDGVTLNLETNRELYQIIY